MTRLLTTIALIVGGLIPLLVDISPSHLLNPDWDSHARVHEAWRLSTNSLIFLLAMYLLWVKGRELLPALLSLSIHMGFVGAAVLMPLYGGVPIGEGIPEPVPFGIPVNIFIFSSMFVLQLIVLLMIFKQKKQDL